MDWTPEARMKAHTFEQHPFPRRPDDGRARQSPRCLQLQ
ncbi:hypothetical protein SynRCC2555_02717 [Synechococcus sp. WH 8101]|nr:hypothetical protein SynRCC2555_02717 [Synechococcus sp. WH 8101]